MVMKQRTEQHVLTGVVANGTYTLTGRMSSALSITHLAYIEFLDAGGAVVAPVAGTAQVQLSPNGTLFFDMGSDATFDVLTADDAAWPVPNSIGLAVSSRIILSGINAGTAATFKAVFWKAE